MKPATIPNVKEAIEAFNSFLRVEGFRTSPYQGESFRGKWSQCWLIYTVEDPVIHIECTRPELIDKFESICQQFFAAVGKGDEDDLSSK